MEWGYVVALLAGLTIEVFFKLIKYKDSLNRNAPVTKYEPISYMSVTQYLSGGDRKWLKYISFRTIPPFIILLLLTAILHAYFPSTVLWIAILLATIISILFRDIKMLFSRKKMISEKLIHFMNIILIIFTGILIVMIGSSYDIAWIAPSLEGVIDNLWSSLLVAMLVVLYLDATNMSSRANEKYADETARNNYILKSYNKTQKKYDKEIVKAAKKHKASIPLLYAILIYEDMNRPAIFRKLENVIVKVTKFELTVGIAQVKSTKPLTDIQSIYLAAEVIRNTYSRTMTEDILSFDDAIKKAVLIYNPDPIYLQNITIVWNCLFVYTYELFVNDNQKQ